MQCWLFCCISKKIFIKKVSFYSDLTCLLYNGRMIRYKKRPIFTPLSSSNAPVTGFKFNFFLLFFWLINFYIYFYLFAHIITLPFLSFFHSSSTPFLDQSITHHILSLSLDKILTVKKLRKTKKILFVQCSALQCSRVQFLVKSLTWRFLTWNSVSTEHARRTSLEGRHTVSSDFNSITVSVSSSSFLDPLAFHFSHSLFHRRSHSNHNHYRYLEKSTQNHFFLFPFSFHWSGFRIGWDWN